MNEIAAGGSRVEASDGMGDDYATLVTTDPEVAKKFGMEEEREYLDDEGDELTGKPL